MASTSQVTAAPKPRHSKMFWIVSDYKVLIKRSLTHIIKSPDELLGTLLQPIMFTLLFVYVFGGSINTGDVSYVNFLIAGILVQATTFGATTTAFKVCNDMQKGIIDRFKSLPMLSSAVLTGHVVADIVRNFVSALVMIAVALTVGFRPEAGVVEWLMIFGILGLFTLAVSWLSAILGLLAKNVEAVQWMTFVTVFPLTFASSAFVEPENMAEGLRAFAENQPLTQVIGAIRALMNGLPIEHYGFTSIAWSIGILVVAFPIASWLFARKIAR